MNKERDQFLTEKLGECWHIVNYGRCEKCNKVIHRDRDEIDDYSLNLHFSSWDGFGKLWECCDRRRWFVHMLEKKRKSSDVFYDIVHPDRFADMIYEYLKENPDIELL
jgi:hypothetical protein